MQPPVSNRGAEYDPPIQTPPPSGRKPKTPPAAKTCPPPKADVVCSSAPKPVVCRGCEYANACLADAAGFEEEECQVKGKKDCPDPKPEIVCAMQYAPVQCDGGFCDIDEGDTEGRCVARLTLSINSQSCTPFQP